jgi:hypothetical protein
LQSEIRDQHSINASPPGETRTNDLQRMLPGEHALRSVKVSRAKRLSTALCVLLVAGLLGPTLAGAEWTTPVDLSAAGQDASNPHVAVDADGDAVFVWRRFDGANYRVQTRALSAAGALSAVQTLSGSGKDASDPQVAVNAAGKAVFTWSRADASGVHVQARARSAAGILSPVQNLSADGQAAFHPQVAVDDTGDAVFTWVRADVSPRQIQARARSASGTLSSIQTLSKAGQDAFEPQVAIDADGDAVFAWRRFDGANYRIQTRARSAAGTLSAEQTLSKAGRDAANHHVAVDADGDAVYTWTRLDENYAERVQTRARSAAGSLSAVQTLNDQGQQGLIDPQVAVDDTGDAVFTWTQGAAPLGASRVHARARSAAGTLSAAQFISDGVQGAYYSQVAVDADGDAVFTWQQWINDGFPPANYMRVEVRTRSAAGTLRPFTTLSDEGQEAVSPQVATDDTGDAVVTWQRSDGTHTRIQASAGP